MATSQKIKEAVAIRRQQVLAYLAAHGPCRVRQVHEGTGLKRQDVQNDLHNMATAGQVETVSIGLWQVKQVDAAANGD